MEGHLASHAVHIDIPARVLRLSQPENASLTCMLHIEQGQDRSIEAHLTVLCCCTPDASVQ